MGISLGILCYKVASLGNWWVSGDHWESSHVSVLHTFRKGLCLNVFQWPLWDLSILQSAQDFPTQPGSFARANDFGGRNAEDMAQNHQSSTAEYLAAECHIFLMEMVYKYLFIYPKLTLDCQNIWIFCQLPQFFVNSKKYIYIHTYIYNIQSSTCANSYPWWTWWTSTWVPRGKSCRRHPHLHPDRLQRV